MSLHVEQMYCADVLCRCTVQVYCPPLTIRVVDCRSFGRFTLVGTHTAPSIHKFLYQPGEPGGRVRQLHTSKETLVSLELGTWVPGEQGVGQGAGHEEAEEDEESRDWWTKYHASLDTMIEVTTISSPLILHEKRIYV